MIQNVYGDDGHYTNRAQHFNLNFGYKDLSLFILYKRGQAMTEKYKIGQEIAEQYETWGIITE